MPTRRSARSRSTDLGGAFPVRPGAEPFGPGPVRPERLAGLGELAYLAQRGPKHLVRVVADQVRGHPGEAAVRRACGQFGAPVTRGRTQPHLHPVTEPGQRFR
ncbi:hypothetical protein GA0070618_3631 [Micromonospora echinospora]|uniref:Uncharacterized protein n=1 Tax=Micromonospora echinospora TaxID=1877 RepID=A0A1C4Y7D3_MICEC|nr:hypothetical protein GA0070618_3631 [Micromonospora echinospora]